MRIKIIISGHFKCCRLPVRLSPGSYFVLPGRFDRSLTFVFFKYLPETNERHEDNNGNKDRDLDNLDYWIRIHQLWIYGLSYFDVDQ